MAILRKWGGDYRLVLNVKAGFGFIVIDTFKDAPGCGGVVDFGEENFYFYISKIILMRITSLDLECFLIIHEVH